jgi:hypothetical protein
MEANKNSETAGKKSDGYKILKATIKRKSS